MRLLRARHSMRSTRITRAPRISRIAYVRPAKPSANGLPPNASLLSRLLPPPSSLIVEEENWCHMVTPADYDPSSLPTLTLDSSDDDMWAHRIALFLHDGSPSACVCADDARWTRYTFGNRTATVINEPSGIVSRVRFSGPSGTGVKLFEGDESGDAHEWADEYCMGDRTDGEHAEDLTNPTPMGEPESEPVSELQFV